MAEGVRVSGRTGSIAELFAARHRPYFRGMRHTGSLSNVLSGAGAPPDTTTLPAIVQTGALVLRKRAAEVAPEKITTPAMQDLVRTMIAVMRDAPGVGLAAPQIGIGLRVIVLEDKPEYSKSLNDKQRRELGRTPFETKTFFNPVLRPVGDERVLFNEGCLSVSGFSALVERYVEVEVEGLDERAQPQKWRVRGWPARILQHECDHLDGTLYVDRMLTRSFATSEEFQANFAGKSVAEIRKLLGV